MNISDTPKVNLSWFLLVTIDILCQITLCNLLEAVLYIVRYLTTFLGSTQQRVVPASSVLWQHKTYQDTAKMSSGGGDTITLACWSSVNSWYILKLGCAFTKVSSSNMHMVLHKYQSPWKPLLASPLPSLLHFAPAQVTEETQFHKWNSNLFVTYFFGLRPIA